MGLPSLEQVSQGSTLHLNKTTKSICFRKRHKSGETHISWNISYLLSSTAIEDWKSGVWHVLGFLRGSHLSGFLFFSFAVNFTSCFSFDDQVSCLILFWFHPLIFIYGPLYMVYIYPCILAFEYWPNFG